MSNKSSLSAALAALCTVAPLACQRAGDDRRIEQAANDSHTFRTYLQGDRIEVACQGGVVTLTGRVKNELHRSLAEETVAGLDGVKRVANRLELQEPANMPTADAWLTTKVTAALNYAQNVNPATIQVGVKDGAVTLTGEASSLAQKELALEVVKDINGVRSVDNQLVIKPSPSEKIAESLDDASVTAMVKAVLLGHRGTHMIATKVKTEKGVVTLEGKARNPAEKELVGRLVIGVKGVQNVQNRMTVES